MRISLFTIFFISFFTTISAQQITITDIDEKVASIENSTVSSTDDVNFETNLPVGVKRTFLNNSITLGFASAENNVSLENIQIFTKFRLPFMQESLYFATKGLKFKSSTEIDFANARLQLISDHQIRLNSSVTLVIKKESNSFVEWDCNGFKAVSLDVIVRLDSSVFLAADKSSKPIECRTTLYAQNLHDIMFSLDFSPFQIKGLTDFIFTLSGISFDMSDHANPEGATLPVNDLIWQGIYAKKISVKFPPTYSPNADKPLEIGGEHVVIDDDGFTGNLFGTLNTPMMGMPAWQFSIDKVELRLKNNELAGGGFTGKMQFEVLDNKPLDYAALFAMKNHQVTPSFEVRLNDTISFKMMDMLNLKLTKDSRFDITIDNKTFVANANLNGYIDVIDKSNLVGIKNLRFEQLQISSKSPYLQGGKFNLDTNDKGLQLASLPIYLENLGFEFSDREAKLNIQAKVSVMGSGEKGISAGSGFSIKAKKDGQWKFDGLELKSMIIDADYSCFKFFGSLAIYQNDQIFGKGVGGSIKLSLDNAFLGAEPIEAECQFGKVNDYNYWYAHIAAPVKIPVGTGIILTQLAGGLYTKMEFKPAKFRYEPNKEIGLGFKAGVKLVAVTESVLKVGAELEMVFNHNLGLNYVSLKGSGAFFPQLGQKLAISKELEMAEKHKRIEENFAKEKSENNQSPISVDFASSYNVPTHTFSASLRASVNLKPAIWGGGEAQIFSSPNKWYFYVGRPSQPIQLEVLKLAKVKSYFMTGNELEPLPDVPSNVREILNKVNRVSPTDPLFNKGAGLAFGGFVGAGFDFDFTPVYASMHIGAGFDVLLKEYKNVGCSNTGALVGMNGWYAQGQAYAYLQGALGVKFRSAKFDILNLGAAALLEAKLPNPSYLEGNIGAKYSILGGLVKGTANLKFKIGEPCEMVAMGNPLGDLTFIGDMKPEEAENNVSVFAMPQIAFNTAIEEEFEVEGAFTKQKYRVKLDEVTLIGEKSGKIEGDFHLNTEKDVSSFSTKKLLPGKEKITLTAQVSVEEWKNNQWVIMKEDNGQNVTERKSFSFTTGERPNNIPEECIEYCYPVKNQFNFYRNESQTAYIKLNRDLDYLFAAEEGGVKYKTTVRYKSAKKSIETTVNYNAGREYISINVPQDLELGGVYEMQILRSQIVENQSSNVQRTEVAVGSDDMTVRQNSLTQTVAGNAETMLYSLPFRASKYETFAAKCKALPEPIVMYNRHSDTKSSLLALDYQTDEIFDAIEAVGMNVDQPSLVTAQGVNNSKWLTETAGVAMYNSLSESDLNSFTSNVERINKRPLKKSVYVGNLNNQSVILNSGDISRGTIENKQGTVRIAYYVPHFVQKDFHQYRTRIANDYSNKEIPDNMLAILQGPGLPDITQDNYTVQLNYTLPGTTSPNSTYSVQIPYFIR